MKIQLTSRNKINNPVDNPSNSYTFEGPFDSEMFNNENSPQYQYLKTQTSNFLQLIDALQILELEFEYIWMGTFENYNGNKANNFVIRTNVNNGKQIFWHKYATASPGSGQNIVYVIQNDEKHKIQLSKWLPTIFGNNN